jgi:hypothetical protein
MADCTLFEKFGGYAVGFNNGIGRTRKFGLIRLVMVVTEKKERMWLY